MLFQERVGRAARLGYSLAASPARYGVRSEHCDCTNCAEINDANVRSLGLAWSFDLPLGNPATMPVEVNGTLYVSSGLSIVRAFNAVTGKLLWSSTAFEGVPHTKRSTKNSFATPTPATDGKHVFVSAEEGEAVDVIDVAQRTQVAQIPVGARPRGIGFAPDGKRAYVAAENADEVYVIDTVTYAVVARSTTWS